MAPGATLCASAVDSSFAGRASRAIRAGDRQRGDEPVSRGTLHVLLDHCMREVGAGRFRFVARSTYDYLSELLVAWKRSAVGSMYVAYREHNRPGRMLRWMARLAELHGVEIYAAKSRQHTQASGRVWGRE